MSTPLAAGTVLIRYACADAALGNTAAVASAASAATIRPRVLMPAPDHRAPRLISANPPASKPSTPTISAMIVSSEEPPPAIELFASIVGAGAAEDSEPAQFTIDPSEYVCWTWNV